MKLQNVLRILTILFIAFFVCILIGLSMDITPAKSSDKNEKGLILNIKTRNKITDQKDLKIYSGISITDHQDDL